MGAYHFISRLGTERLIISGLANFIIALAVCTGLNALGVPIIPAAVIAFLFLIAGTALMAGWLPAGIIGIGKRKPWLSVAWLVLALISVVLISRLSLFMIFPSQTQYSLFPQDAWMVEHCCLTAYSESARLTNVGEANVYIQKHYIDRKLSGFRVDNYHYPPPFLLLPLAMQSITGGNFLSLRMLWFSVSLFSFMTAIILMVFRLEPEGKLRMIGMSPLILCSLPLLAGLQMSNVQVMLIAVSIIAMILFKKQAPAGGMLLAMSAASKIFPGILAFYLFAQKKYREVLWTAVFVVVLTILAFLIVGPDPFLAFFGYELPKLSSGEAFARPFSRVFAVARNMSPFGIAVKLQWLGIDGFGLEAGRVLGAVYLLLILALAYWAARKQPRSETETISIWISLLSLGSLASPFAPANYVLVPVIILVCLNREVFRPAAAVMIWLILCVPFYISREAPFIIQALSSLPSQLIAIGIPAFILYRAGAVSAEGRKSVLPGSVTTT